MKAHLRYLRYVLRHKWFVFIACWHLRVPVWQAVCHDWTKFLPSEWFPYVRHFYGNYPQHDPKDPCMWMRRGYYGATTKEIKERFDVAWLHHQKRNQHHWQRWVLAEDSGAVYALPMPDKHLREMVADWIGAGRAVGKPDTEAWFLANVNKMQLEDGTRYRVAQVIKEAQRKGLIP